MCYDTNSIVDFLPASKMKCLEWGNPSHSPNSEPWLNPLMVVIGNKKKRLVENLVVSFQRRRPTSHKVNLPHRTKATRINLGEWAIAAHGMYESHEVSLVLL